MIKVGITGGIGSGKTYVCHLLSQRGIPVYNCDEEAKRLMRENAAIREQLCQLIGKEAYIGNTLNKTAIAAFLFANAHHAESVNSIVHPIVRKDFEEWVSRQLTDIVVQECALLFESGFHNMVDTTVEVYAPKHIRLLRAQKRDQATKEQIEARMAHQMDEKEKRQRADYCITNDGTLDLRIQLNLLLEKIKHRKKIIESPINK